MSDHDDRSMCLMVMVAIGLWCFCIGFGAALVLVRIFPKLAGVVLLLLITISLHAAQGYWTTAEVTAYCPCSLCCGDSADKHTANMTSTDAEPYNFAADKSLPFGAQIYVPTGLGVLDRVRADDRWFVVDDRGGALDTEAQRYGVLRLDLRVKDHWWAVLFGRRTIPVFIIK